MDRTLTHPGLEAAFRTQPPGQRKYPEASFSERGWGKKVIICTISESWRANGFKTSKALQIAINTLNYPVSLKAFTLLFFPAQKQAPDCGCSEWNIQEGVEPTGQEKGGGREGEGKGSGARERSAQLAGGRQSRRLCGPLPAAERHAAKARWSWALPQFLGTVFFAQRNGERGTSGLRWLPEDAFISGSQHCLRSYRKPIVSTEKKRKSTEGRPFPQPNSL